MISKLIGKVLGAAIEVFLIALTCYGIVWALVGISGLLS
jgi:hypothetical protein